MHGYPDYGLAQPRQTVYPVTDLAEAVARLESIDTFDRRGDVVFLDSFECGLSGCFGTGYGTGAAIDTAVGKARNGGCSVKLTTGSDGACSARLERLQPYPALSNMGIEYSFTIPVTSRWIEAHIAVRQSGTTYQGSLAYSVLTEELYYTDVAGVDHLISGNVGTYASDNCFNTMKLVVDFMTNTYVRAIVNDMNFDLTGIDLWTYALAGSPVLDVFAFLQGASGANAVHYLDDLILTQNEPA